MQKDDRVNVLRRVEKCRVRRQAFARLINKTIGKHNSGAANLTKSR
jgi:hypothetical protein